MCNLQINSLCLHLKLLTCYASWLFTVGVICNLYPAEYITKNEYLIFTMNNEILIN